MENNVLIENKEELQTPYRLIVTNGTIFREEDGKNIKRTGYARKLATIVSNRLRNNPDRDVELSAINDASVSNMLKTCIYAFSELSLYGKKPVIKSMSFKPVKIGENDKEVMSKVILIGVEND